MLDLGLIIHEQERDISLPTIVASLLSGGKSGAF
jgi:hypothetical protein